MKNATGWIIHFDPTKMSTLENGTGQSFWILHDAYLQPSRLQITPAGGAPLGSFDTRANKKFDSTVRQVHFRHIEPGAQLPLFELRITELDGAFQLQWGPYRIGPVPPGKYEASVIWEAQQTQYLDEASHQRRKQEGAFVGTVRSAPTPLELPLR